MTPAIKLLQKQNIKHQIHRYKHDRDADSYGLEAADKLGVAAERVYKTLVIELESHALATAIVPVTNQLALKAVATALGAKRAQMAQPTVVQRATGYVLGGVSPLGQKKKLDTVIDSSAKAFETIFVSAGKRGLEIELAPGVLLELLGGHYAAIADQ